MTRAIIVLVGLVLGNAAGGEMVTLTVNNPLAEPRPAAVCRGPAALLGEGIAPGAYTAVTRLGRPTAVQVDDIDGDGVADELVLVVDVPALGHTTVWIDTSRKWTGPDCADVRLSWRYPDYAALDTDRMAFGLYGLFAPAGFPGALQWDLYGKRPEVWRLSLDALEPINYHEDNPVAVDYLLVGPSMGLGGPIIGEARPLPGVNGDYSYREICDGPVRAGLEVTVTGWSTPSGGTYDVTARYFVYAHHDFIDADFAVRPPPSEGDPFGLGVRRIPHPDVFLGSKEEGILAVMGQQEGIVGKTGLAIIFSPAQFLRWEVRANEDDAYVVRMSSGDGHYRARLVGVWSEGGMASTATFTRHLRDLAARFAAPLSVSR